jgi:predicted kinase
MTTLHLLCGKIAAGKSTLSAELGRQPHTIVIAEDHWTSRLFGSEMTSVADYIRCSARLRDAMGPHVITLLKVGLSVVLDFPANTIANRAWMRSIAGEAVVGHELHFLDVSDEVCRGRLRARNAQGNHEFAVNDEEFELITSHFIVPTSAEGLNIIVHRP